jgi:hypothetical protein
MIYYIVELLGIPDNITTPVLVTEETIGDFVKNLDKKSYTLINVHGVGELNTNIDGFIKKEIGLENGDLKDA